MRLGIAAKTTIVLAVFVLVGTALVGGVLTYTSAGILRDVSLSRLDHGTTLAARHLFGVIDGARHDVAFLVQTRAVGTLARSGADVNNQVSELFQALARENDWYAQLRFIGIEDEGRERVRVDRVGRSVFRIANDELQQKGQRDYFRDTVVLKPGDTYFSAINLNREHGEISRPLLPVLRVAQPVYIPGDDEQPQGIVIINIDMGKVFAQMRREVAPGGELYVANKVGDYLAHPDPARTFGFDFGKRFRLQQDFDGVEPLISGEIDNLLLEQPAHNGHEGKAVALRAIDVPGYRGERQLIIGIAEPFTRVSRDVGRLTRQSLWLMALLGGTGVLVGMLLVWRLLRPLLRISQAVAGFQGNNSEMDLPLERSDEIGLLARRFQSMTERIKAQLHQLEEEHGRLNSLVSTAADAIVLVDQQGVIEHCNDAVQRLFGYSSDELIGKNVKLLMNERDGSRHDDYVRDYLQTGKGGVIGVGREVKGLRKDGSEVPLYVSIGEFELGGERKFTGILHDISDRVRLEQELRELANTDELTGAANRRSFIAIANEELKRARRHGYAVALMLLDLDYFKEINDRFGHAAGDTALVAMAETCRSTLRSHETLGRMGGDEFAVILPDTDLDTALHVAARVSEAVAALAPEGLGGEACMSLSIGITAVTHETLSDLESLMAQADAALYRAKANGRGRVEVAAGA